MNIYKFLFDFLPGGYQDQQPWVRWLIKGCAFFPANAWTISRSPGALIVIWLSGQSIWLAIIAFALFAFTDFIDGKVARWRGEADGSGVFLDPIVDKVFVLPLLWWFGLYRYDLFDEHLFWAMIMLEIAGRFLIATVWKARGEKIDSQKAKAKGWGKWKFIMQIFLFFFLFIAFSNMASWWFFVLNIILFIILIFAAVSVVSYIWAIPEPKDLMQALIIKFRVRQ